MIDTPRPSETDALRRALLDNGSVKIEFAIVWQLWAQAAPRLVGDPGQAAILRAALIELSTTSVIDLPKRAWDMSVMPHLPRFVVVPSARRPGNARAWVSFPWRLELGWVASLPTLSAALFHDLTAINDWLSRSEGRELLVVPVRYRSAEIFGREKRIDELERTALFGPGRLALSRLSCVRIAPPVPAAVVGDGPDVLIVENSDTYWVTVDALRTSRGHTIGAVGWGSGNTFPAQVASLEVDVAGQGPLRGTAWYWGDFDPAGMSTAVTAAEVAPNVRVRPALGLWSAMVGLPVQDAGKFDWSGAVGESWLGADPWNRLAYVRTARGRIAQESVPVATVTAWAGRIASSAVYAQESAWRLP
jgi:hypothetical protein